MFFAKAQRAVADALITELFSSGMFNLATLSRAVKAQGRELTDEQWNALRPLNAATWEQMGEGKDEVQNYIRSILAGEVAQHPKGWDKVEV